ncbi:MAG: bifunctional phosphopantothenoylcysteine decarboxylase/phosphopantothenate--cysteine ligase CoaBC [Eubacteriaceae bacterium]|nr:bifunctional phosphopantothenoylcysteine decarboxylase/phosphopantothenate--cysteine ligase CoaBC [Eubacteriaceae bacterium]
MDLTNKTVIIGVTGSIAAYKMADCASALAKQGCDVHVIMTKNATEIISPLTFSTLTGHKTIVDTFDHNVNYNVAHVALAKRADALIVAPATANIIAKLRHGLADDMLTTTALACTCPKLISPAMNTAMYENQVVQRNIEGLKTDGWQIIEPDAGILACKDEGKGKLPKPEAILDALYPHLYPVKDMTGIRVLITAGPTREAIDPVRFVSNLSSGKMGYALAKIAALRGGDVTLVSGPVDLAPPYGVDTVNVLSAAEMYDAVVSRAEDQDIIVKAAAVADYTPVAVADNKIKKSDGDMTISLKRTRDILAHLGAHKRDGQLICGFSMETENLIDNSRGKLKRKHIDMIAANNVKDEGAGFKTDTNLVTLITDEKTVSLPLMSKDDVASAIFDALLKRMGR